MGLKSGRHFRPEVRINPIVRVRKKGALRRQKLWFSSYSFWPDHLTHACDVGPGMAFYRSARETDDYQSNHQDVTPSAGKGPGVPQRVTNAAAFPSGSAVSGPSPLRSYPSEARHHRLSPTISNNLGQCPHVGESWKNIYRTTGLLSRYFSYVRLYSTAVTL